ncbi:metalloprotease PmbA [Carnimonas nigrificans]|uniref:metalloprotease PmbA n=1 Tax=Carnimonas nigrificans TaxID=64323 RepID=UPI0004703E2C|nr:metalloprotease PmbA [Carnimonas nigrificans]
MDKAFDAHREQQRLEAQTAYALEQARQLGATACEVGASAQQGMHVSVRLGDVETMELATDQGIGVTVYVGKRKGSASTSNGSEAAIKETVAKAYDIARYTGEDDKAGLAPVELMASDFPDLDLYHPWALEPDQAIEIARRCEAAGTAVEGITNSEGALLSSGTGVSVYGNSHGFLHAEKGTSHSVACRLIAGSGDAMQRDADYTAARSPDDLYSVEEVGRRAAANTLARLAPRNVTTGRYPIIFAPRMAIGLVGNLLGAIAGGALYREASFLCDTLGEKLLPEWLSLYESPRERRGLRSANFDADGVATRNNRFIEQGVLAQYLLSSYSARRLGLATTANAGGARNVRIDAPLSRYQEMIAGIERGVIVTEMMGQGVNAVTGDYSRGASGFWVEQGEIQYPIEGFTVAGNLREMFAQLKAVGDDVDRRGNIHSGSWWVDGMTVAG